jgi:hypothetical protein
LCVKSAVVKPRENWLYALVFGAFAFGVFRCIVGVRRSLGLRDALLAAGAVGEILAGTAGLFFLWDGRMNFIRVFDADPAHCLMWAGILSMLPPATRWCRAIASATIRAAARALLSASTTSAIRIRPMMIPPRGSNLTQTLQDRLADVGQIAD